MRTFHMCVCVCTPGFKYFLNGPSYHSTSATNQYALTRLQISQVLPNHPVAALPPLASCNWSHLHTDAWISTCTIYSCKRLCLSVELIQC